MIYFIIGFSVAPWYTGKADRVYAETHNGKRLDEGSRTLVQAVAAILWIILVPREIRSNFAMWRKPNVPLINGDWS